VGSFRSPKWGILIPLDNVGDALIEEEDEIKTAPAHVEAAWTGGRV
jgi:hypothetical protein